jgi:hypothetical protein
MSHAGHARILSMVRLRLHRTAVSSRLDCTSHKGLSRLCVESHTPWRRVWKSTHRDVLDPRRLAALSGSQCRRRAVRQWIRGSGQSATDPSLFRQPCPWRMLTDPRRAMLRSTIMYIHAALPRSAHGVRTDLAAWTVPSCLVVPALTHSCRTTQKLCAPPYGPSS